MKQIHILKQCTPLLLLSLLVGCSADEDNDPVDITMPQGAMVFSGEPGWLDDEPMGTGVTRTDGHDVGEDPNNPYLISTSRNDHWHDGQIVYFTKRSDVNDSQADYYSRYVYSSSTGQFKSKDPLIWKQLTEDVCAFYRGDMGMLGQHYVKLTANFSVKQDQSGDENYQASDFVFFRGNVSYNDGVQWKSDGRVKDLVFNHKVAQIRLNIFCPDPTKIDSTHVYIGNRHFGINASVLANAAYANSYTTTQNLLTLTDTGESQNKTMVMNHNHNGIKDNKPYAQYRLFMIPQTLVSKWAGPSGNVTQDGYISRFIQIKYDGVWYYYAINIDTAKNVFRNLTQGRYHTFNITLSIRENDNAGDEYDMTPTPGNGANS